MNPIHCHWWHVRSWPSSAASRFPRGLAHRSTDMLTNLLGGCRSQKQHVWQKRACTKLYSPSPQDRRERKKHYIGGEDKCWLGSRTRWLTTTSCTCLLVLPAKLLRTQSEPKDPRTQTNMWRREVEKKKKWLNGLKMWWEKKKKARLILKC